MKAKGPDGRSLESPCPANSRNELKETRSALVLPREVGVLLVVAGVGGIILPGPIGTPFLLLGGLVLWPGAFDRVDVCLEKRFPRIHHYGLRQIKRFLDDLNRRYPLPK